MSLLHLLRSTNQAMDEESDKIFGVVLGIVEDIKDPKGLGRVKVNFPWLADKQDAVSIKDDDRAQSYWARIATLMAGRKRGSFFVPEVGDEVLVAFEHGKLDRPYVIGMLWNTEDEPPEVMDQQGKNDIRAIYTRSGHKIVFNDSTDAPSIRIEDQTRNNYILIESKTNTMTIQIDGDLTIDAGGKITIKAAKDISIETKADLKLEATGSGSIETRKAIEIKSSVKALLDGGSAGQAEIKAATVSVSGVGVTKIEGKPVMLN